jgi:hypothetical protein
MWCNHILLCKIPSRLAVPGFPGSPGKKPPKKTKKLKKQKLKKRGLYVVTPHMWCNHILLCKIPSRLAVPGFPGKEAAKKN